MDETVEIALIGGQRPEVIEQLSKHFRLHPVFAEPDPLAALKPLGARIRGAAGHGMAGLSRAHIELLPRLEICALNGVGLETSDVAAARERGIVITTTPVLFDDVADIAIGLALAACRRIAEGDRFIRAGKWGPSRLPLGRKLTGMRVGIIGLGRIGVEVAKRLEAFRCEIGYVDPAPRLTSYRAYSDAVAMARDSDILFLCAAGGPKSTARPIVDHAIIEALGPRGIFVNVSRGWLVDEAALVEALVAGRLGGAGLDVFHDEPNVPAALLSLENVVLSPHIASSTVETMTAMGDLVVANLVSWFEGKGALTPVT